MDRRFALAVVALALATLACNAPERSPTPGAAPTPYRAPTDPPSPAPPSPEPSPRPPATATSRPASTAASSGSVTGALVDFENWGSWRRGDQPNGTFEQSRERAQGGSACGKLDYDFPTSGNDFVVFVHLTPISGSPERIRAWVYGDGSGHFFNVWIRDAEGEVWQVPLGQVEHHGWKRLAGEIEAGQEWPWSHISGPANGTVDYPIEFYALALDDQDDSFTGSGTIFVDEITAP